MVEEAPVFPTQPALSYDHKLGSSRGHRIPEGHGRILTDQWPTAAHQGLITLPSGFPTAHTTRVLRPLERLWVWPLGVHGILENKIRWSSACRQIRDLKVSNKKRWFGVR